MTAPASFLILQEPSGKDWLTIETEASASFADIAELVDDAQTFRVLAVNMDAGTVTDATRDVLAIFAARSIKSSNPPSDAIAGMIEAARIPFYSQEDSEADERESAAWDRQRQSLRPSISTHI